MGRVVTDGDGWVLYRFDQDGTDPPKSNCAKACTRQWPPALTDGNPELVGIQYRAIGVVIRADGTMQLTLAGSPLYRHAGDLRPGDARGQGVNAAWFTVTPEGRKNQAARP